MHSRGVTIHEYAHEIFHRNIIEFIKDYKRISGQSMIASTQKVTKAQLEYDKFLKETELRMNEIDVELRIVGLRWG